MGRDKRFLRVEHLAPSPFNMSPRAECLYLLEFNISEDVTMVCEWREQWTGDGSRFGTGL